jgi:hypothetical protein
MVRLGLEFGVDHAVQMQCDGPKRRWRVEGCNLGAFVGKPVGEPDVECEGAKGRGQGRNFGYQCPRRVVGSTKVDGGEKMGSAERRKHAVAVVVGHDAHDLDVGKERQERSEWRGSVPHNVQYAHTSTGFRTPQLGTSDLGGGWDGNVGGRLVLPIVGIQSVRVEDEGG